jgi:hypothetical protein
MNHEKMMANVENPRSTELWRATIADDDPFIRPTGPFSAIPSLC